MRVLWWGAPSATDNRPVGIEVACEGATLFIHGLRLLHAMAVNTDPDRRASARFHTVTRDGPALEPSNGGPVRVHRGENISFTLPPPLSECQLSWVRAEVAYSLDGLSDPLLRRVEWRGVEGHDFYLPEQAE